MTEPSGNPAAALALVHYIGRFDLRAPNAARFDWPGTAIAATFQGTSLDATLHDTGTTYFSVVVDGKAPTVLSTSGSRETYTLATGLSPGPHTVVLTKRTEAFVGVVTFRGFNVPGGALVPSQPPFTRRIEYVGDSITCGYGVLGRSGSCPFSPDTEDETSAYGALAGGALNAGISVIAWSGRGMVRAFDGVTSDQMPVLFEQTLGSEKTPWSFATPDPDVVVINLGSNDFAQGDPGDAFERAYVAFLKQLRGHYPRARVICTLSPMLDDSETGGLKARTLAKTAIENAMKERTAAGDSRLSYFAFEPPRAGEGFGCDGHPSAATQRTMAGALVGAIRELTGW